MAQHPRGQSSSYSSPREPEIVLFLLFNVASRLEVRRVAITAFDGLRIEIIVRVTVDLGQSS
jgi:hypothetical protein